MSWTDCKRQRKLAKVQQELADALGLSEERRKDVSTFNVQNAELRGQVDYLVARFTELAEEFDTIGEQRRATGRLGEIARGVAWSAAAAKVRQVVTEVSSDDNETAT
jgi:hypothetical protein